MYIIASLHLHLGEKMNVKVKFIGCACSLAVFGLAGCKANGPEPEKASAIVSQVENAGSGSLSGVDEGSMQAWLNGHKDIARQINPECKAVGVKAPASWATTTEGRLCAADGQVMFMMPTQHYKAF